MDLDGHAITGMDNTGRRHSRFPDDDVDQIWRLRWLEARLSVVLPLGLPQKHRSESTLATQTRLL
jgi:hypothetical protein